MAVNALTGSRIREKRISEGIRQAALAQSVGISAAYLNLIEHNRRRIGGKLLADIADTLNVGVTGLTDGAGEAVINALHEAAASIKDADVEADRIEEFAGRFPGWAGLIASQSQRLHDLERNVEALAGRATHDTHLAASLHELLSTVTAIGSAATILVETDQIEDEWRDRFHRNIHEDSQRLAESSQALVSYLEKSDDTGRAGVEPRDEFDAWIEARDYHFPGLERALAASYVDIMDDGPPLRSAIAREIGQTFLARYHRDSKAMPLGEFSEAAREHMMDPVALAGKFDVDVGRVLRRLASLPNRADVDRLGLAICDNAGALIFRKPTEGFAMPRDTAACPLWPLYQALARPMTPIRAIVETAGRDPTRYLVYAFANPVGRGGFDDAQVYEATMLIIPPGHCEFPGLPVRPVGSTCRVCPRTDCAARREASILLPQKR